MSRLLKNKDTIAILIIVGIMVSQVCALHAFKSDVKSDTAVTAISESNESNEVFGIFDSQLAMIDYNIVNTPIPFTIALLGLGILGACKKK